jgi:hypothetical protein
MLASLRRLLTGLVLAAAPLAVAAAPATNAPAAFGFSGVEIFPVDPFISQLNVADLDGDGRNDLIVVNNARSKINLLFNQTGHTNTPAPRVAGVKRNINELPPDARFRLDSIASEKRIAALVVADLNGDGRPDLAYYGDPRELLVLYNQGTNGWSTPKRWPLDDGLFSPNALVTGDLNGDGRVDLLLLAENHAYFLVQQADGTLAEPVKLPLGTPANLVLIMDVNGDRRNDLVLANWESPTPIRVRLQGADGQLGPEMYFKLPAIRALCVDRLETNGEAQLVSIARDSGRAAVAHFVPHPGEPLGGGLRAGQFSVIPLLKTAKAGRGLLWADLRHDGQPALLVAEPESGQLSISYQKPDGTLGAPQTFPSLTGVSELAVADWEGDGQPEIFMLSPDERHVGVTRLGANGRLPFPTMIPTDGRPLAMAVGPLVPGAPASLVIVVDNEGKRTLVIRSADGRTHPQPLNEKFKSNPSAMAIHDVDQDGLPDIVILSPFEKIKVLHQKPGGAFEELDVPVPGGALEDPWLSVADVDGDGHPELLLPQRNFLRAVVLQPDGGAGATTNRNGWVFQVREQINGASSDSLITGATVLPAGTNPPTVFLLDANRRALTVCTRRPAGVWQVARNLPLPVADFDSLQVLPARGKNPPTLAFPGVNAVGLLALGGDAWDLTELDSYETPIKQGQLRDVLAADLNGDGRKDLVFLETARGYVDLVEFNRAHKLVAGNRWPVFEERTFRSRRSDMPEPREAAVLDVTGDGKNDLLLIVHDRILLYPQE